MAYAYTKNQYQVNIVDQRTGGSGEDGSSPQFSKNRYIKKSNVKKSQIRGQHGKEVMNYSVRSLAAFGMSVRFARQFNTMAGEYTGRRMRAEKHQAQMQIATMGVAAAKFGPLGMTYAAVNMGQQVLSHRIENRVQNQRADIKHMRSGNNTRGRSRQSGGKV